MDSFYEDLQAGAYYRMEENFSQALVHFNRAVAKQPYNFEAYLERGVNYHLRNQVFFALHDFRYALYHCTESYACQNASKKAQYFIHLLQGLIYETNSHWEKAVTEYERALLCDKQGFYAYFSIGYAYGSLSLANGQGDNTQLYKQAIRYFLKALALIDGVPHHRKYYSFYQSVIHTNIAWMQKRLEQNTEALLYYQKAIDANPRHVRAYFSRAILHRGMNQRELALKDYSSCIQIFEDQYKTLVTRGNVHSVNIVKKRMASILEDRGLTNMDAANESDEAKRDFTRAIELCPQEVPFAYLILSFLYTDTENGYQGALKVLENGVNACCTNPGMTNDPQCYKDMARLLSFKADVLVAINRDRDAQRDLIMAARLQNMARID